MEDTYPGAAALEDTLQGLQDFEEDDDGGNFVEAALAVVEEFAAKGKPFNAEEIIAACIARRIRPRSPYSMGAVFRKASRDGIIKRVGVRVSSNPKFHASPETLWIGTDFATDVIRVEPPRQFYFGGWGEPDVTQ